jgi:hypothetical protein
VPPKLTRCLLTRIPCVMQQGGESQRHSFQVRRTTAVIPLLYNGSCRIGLLICGLGTFVLDQLSPVQLGGPFDFCAFTLLSDCGHSRPRAWLSGNRFEVYSSSSAFLVCCWSVFYDGEWRLSRGKTLSNHFNIFSTFLTRHFHIEHDIS